MDTDSKDLQNANSNDANQKEGQPHIHRRQHSVVNRLARIEGHVHAVKRMVEEGTPCPDVLVQIAALRSALDSVGRIVLEDHIRECMVDAVNSGNFERSWLDLERSLQRFVRS